MPELLQDLLKGSNDPDGEAALGVTQVYRGMSWCVDFVLQRVPEAYTAGRKNTSKNDTCTEQEKCTF